MLMVGWVDCTHNDSYSLCRYWDFASVHACATLGVRMEAWSVLRIFFNLVKKIYVCCLFFNSLSVVYWDWVVRLLTNIKDKKWQELL